MPTKEALRVYCTEWLLDQTLPELSYPEAEDYFHTVRELFGIEHIDITQNTRMSKGGAQCRSKLRRDSIDNIAYWDSVIHISSKISRLTEGTILHEIAHHTAGPRNDHNFIFITELEHLYKTLLTAAQWAEYLRFFKIFNRSNMTKLEMNRVFWQNMDEIKKSS